MRAGARTWSQQLVKNSAPKERHNLAYGASRGLRARSLSPFPLSRPRGRGCRRRVRAFEPRARALG